MDSLFLILHLLISSPFAIFSLNEANTLLISREDAAYRFKEGELLESGDRIKVTASHTGLSQINVTFYRGCDIPLRFQYIPTYNWIHLWQRKNGKFKHRHTFQEFLANPVTDQLLFYLRFMDGYMNILVNTEDDKAEAGAYQYRIDIKMNDLTRIAVHGTDISTPTIEVDHRGDAMKSIAASNTKKKGPNF